MEFKELKAKISFLKKEQKELNSKKIDFKKFNFLIAKYGTLSLFIWITLFMTSIVFGVLLVEKLNIIFPIFPLIFFLLWAYLTTIWTINSTFDINYKINWFLLDFKDFNLDFIYFLTQEYKDDSFIQDLFSIFIIKNNLKKTNLNSDLKYSLEKQWKKLLDWYPNESVILKVFKEKDIKKNLVLLEWEIKSLSETINVLSTSWSSTDDVKKYTVQLDLFKELKEKVKVYSEKFEKYSTKDFEKYENEFKLLDDLNVHMTWIQNINELLLTQK